MVTGTTISSTVMNNTLEDIANNGLTNCLLKDGTQAVTAAITFTNFRLTNLGAATVRTDAAQAAQVQNSAYTVLASVAGTNTITGATTPALTAYTAGQRFSFVPANTVTGAATLNVSGNGAGAVQLAGLPLSGQEIVTGIPAEVVVTTSTPVFELVGSGFAPLAMLKTICNGRLTATAGTAITTSDVTSASSMVFTPHGGNQIALYASAAAAWKVISFAEVTTAVPATASQLHDWFGYLKSDNSLGLVAVSWTNDTTRSDAIVLQNGVYVASANPARRYLGTSGTRASGIIEDSESRRYLWNNYNRVKRVMRNPTETANSWTYTTAAFRQANSNTANQFDFVQGLSENIVSGRVYGLVANDTGGIRVAVGIGLNSSSSSSAQLLINLGTNGAANAQAVVSAEYIGHPGIGRRGLACLEYSQAVGVTTWYGDNNTPSEVQLGISGEIIG